MTLIVKNLISADRPEHLVLAAIRQNRKGALRVVGGTDAILVPWELSNAIGALIALVRDIDPDIVRILPRPAKELSFFEVQLITMLARATGPAPEGADAILEWWLPDRLIMGVREMLGDIITVIGALDIQIDRDVWDSQIRCPAPSGKPPIGSWAGKPPIGSWDGTSPKRAMRQERRLSLVKVEEKCHER